MIVNSCFPNTHVKLPLTPHQNLAILHRRAFQVREHRVWRRRRLKTNRTTLLVVRSQLGPPLFENLFQNLVSQFPSVNSLDLVAPSLGFASGVAIYLSRLMSNGDNSRVSDVGEWILFTSPTPFNRFVVLRCPSISFEGSNDKLVKEERHFVKLNSGRIRVSGSDDDEVEEGKLVYQRECVSTDDGGVISLDWPADLDLTEEHGLDTTLLLVPGTAEGSMNYDIRSFVRESLKHGCFPVVMNPRGCAGSPLTTPRLFTAGDSDDICKAIQFINSARPWTTLMGVGWGYGANMLTKYLAEVGEKTPLTAATCIDNPFDLEEATRSSPNHIALDQKLTGGLVDILRSNKELFHGRAKGFDVENGLLAKSVRDFEKSISMISSGFNAIERFYATCSTRSVVGNVKIPVLFIQNDDGTVPLFSIPRSLIAENPFTSLLLCSCSPSSVIASGRSAIPWYRHLTIQWLAAVELGLLKGRHPLLKDVDVTINPSKGLALLEGRSSDKSGKVNKLLNLSQSNGYAVYPMKENLKESDTSAGIGSRSRQDSQRNTVFEDKGLQQESNGILEQTSPVGAELTNEEVSPVDVETGQVLQTTHAVLNMLDVTMPGTLTEEQKKKVLTAVGQGKTVMNALQDAVPEDVRAKLTTAVSGVLQNQGANLKLDGLLNIGRIPDVASGLKSKIGELSSDEDPHSLGVGDLADSSNDNQVTVDKTAGGLESELEASDAMQKPIDTSDTGQVQPTTFGGEISNSVTHQNVDTSRERTAQHVDSIENGSATGATPDFAIQSERTSGTEDLTIDQHKMDHDGGLATLDMKEDNIQHNLEKVTNLSADENQVALSTETEEGLTYSASSSEAQPTESIDNDNVKSEEKSMDSVLNQSSSDSPTFSVSQAFDAFTGMDDSTQVAVNSVFGVIEDMITQLDNKTELEDKNDVKDRGTTSITEKHGVDDEHDDMMRKEENENDPRGTTSITEKHGVDDEHDDTMRKEENENDPSSQPDTIHNLSSDEGRNSENDARTRWAENEKLIRSPDPFKGNNSDNSRENGMVNHVTKVGSGTSDKLVSSKLSSEHSNKSRHLQSIPLFIAANPYSAAPLYKEHLLKNLLSKIPNSKPLDLDRTTALFLDYIPEEGKWKLLEHPGNIEDSGADVATHEGVKEVTQVHSPSKADTDEVIEPQYVIMDAEHHQEPVREYDPVDRTNQEVVISNDSLESFVKSVILNSLKVEVGRRLSAESMNKMEPKLSRDMEQVANAVSLAAGQSKNPLWFSDGDDCNLEKLGTLNGEQIIRDMALAIQETNYLRSVLPYGVVVGSCLAALRKYFDVAAVSGIDHSDAVTLSQINHSVLRNHVRLNQTESDRVLLSKRDQKQSLSKSIDGEKTDLKKLSNSTVMVGAVTAALGASAVMVHQQKGNHEEETDKHEQETADKSQNNIVASLAEKAMSVAGPVVPMKEDGKVDQERLVALLAEWGQKGGMLRLVGKIALLWGGIRGAMSLIDRLILFLRIAERPLFQRILGFVCLVLVLWSPVVVPMLPTLMQSWVTHNSSKFAELVCIIGLYCSITMLVMIWGKRIRGYENPFEQYGLDFSSLSKIQNYLKGLVGGVVVVSAIHSLNVLLGCVGLSWPSTSISRSSDAVTWIKVYGKTLSLVARGLVTGTCVAVVEELIFRSWLPDEIATDLGYYRGIIISGLAFALVQRSPWAIPGLWLLSLGLAGARQRNEGSLSIPIGLRTGVLASNFVLKMGGFLTYQPNFPPWVTSAHPFQPFSGIAGLAVSLLLAIVLHPRQPLHQ